MVYCAVVHFAQLVGHTGIEQDTFRGGGFACVDVGGDTDVAVALDGGLASHDGSLIVWRESLPVPASWCRRTAVLSGDAPNRDKAAGKNACGLVSKEHQIGRAHV